MLAAGIRYYNHNIRSEFHDLVFKQVRRQFAGARILDAAVSDFHGVAETVRQELHQGFGDRVAKNDDALWKSLWIMEYELNQFLIRDILAQVAGIFMVIEFICCRLILAPVLCPECPAAACRSQSVSPRLFGADFCTFADMKI